MHAQPCLQQAVCPSSIGCLARYVSAWVGLSFCHWCSCVKHSKLHQEVIDLIKKKQGRVPCPPLQSWRRRNFVPGTVSSDTRHAAELLELFGAVLYKVEIPATSFFASIERSTHVGHRPELARLCWGRHCRRGDRRRLWSLRLILVPLFSHCRHRFWNCTATRNLAHGVGLHFETMKRYETQTNMRNPKPPHHAKRCTKPKPSSRLLQVKDIPEHLPHAAIHSSRICFRDASQAWFPGLWVIDVDDPDCNGHAWAPEIKHSPIWCCHCPN